MVHECLTECGTNPSDIHNVMSAFNAKHGIVEKNSSSLYLMISCLQRSQNFLGSCVAFLKIACLHASFTAYENFYKHSKNALSYQLLSTCSPSEVSEIRNPTIKHISTYTLVHSSIITYMGDHFLVIFCP